MRTLAALLIALSAANARADEPGFGAGPAAYLTLPQGARALAMGRARLAVPSDASDIHANPATLPALRTNHFTASTARLAQDREYSFLGMAVPFRLNPWMPFSDGDPITMSFSAALTRFGVDELEYRDEFGKRGLTFENQERAISLSWGATLYERSTFGLTYRILRQELGTDTATGRTIDIGFWTRDPAPFHRLPGTLDFGFVVKNLGGKMRWKLPETALQNLNEYEEPLLTSAAWGGAYHTADERWLFALDVEKTREQPARLRAGVEWKPVRFAMARAGMNGTRPAVGFGIDLDLYAVGARLDYAFEFNPGALDNPQWLTLNFQILPGPSRGYLRDDVGAWYR